jgi:hypothetical protein
MMFNNFHRARMYSHIRHFLDASALSASLLSVLGFLQPIAAFIATVLSICWVCVQFHDRRQRKVSESLTVKE